MNLPRDAAIAGGSAAAGAAIADRASQQPGAGDARPGTGEARPGTGEARPGRGNRPNRGDQISQLPQERRQYRRDRGQNVRGYYRGHHPRWNFWRGHPNWAGGRITRPYRWATWGALSGWFVWGPTSAQPIYYDYGYTGSVYYENNDVYNDGEEIATAQEYAEQAIAMADDGTQALDTAVADGTADQIEWMSLGVFALADQEDGDPTMYFQLAVDKDGIIVGSYYNESTDETLPVQGSVDKESQRAAWSIGEHGNTVLETGIYNLTQDETPVLVHFGDEQTQTWLLVRLPEPEEGQEEAEDSSATSSEPPG